MNELAFDHPTWLLALWLLVPLALLLARAEGRRRAAALDFAHAPMAARLLPPLRGARPWLRGGALLASLVFLVVAAAGPRFGVTFEPVSERGADLLVLLDVSKSMLSQDVAPNRLERAKSDVRDLVARIVGHRLGLVVFAGKAVVACPLTTDRGFFLQSLDQVDPRSAPRGGTAIGDAIRVALQTLPPQRDRDQAMILITDGEDQDSYPLEAAKAATERGVKIFTVGLGDPTEGARVPVKGADGGATFLKHEGQEVWSKMQEGLLTELATATGGAYVPARTSSYDLGEIYTKHLADLSAGEIRMTQRRRLTPRFQLFLGLGLACALLERLIGPNRRRAALAPAASLGAVGLLAFVASVTLGGTARAAGEVDAPEEVRAAIELLKQGKSDDALARLEAAATAEPKNLAIVFDRACAKEAKGDFDGARADLTTVAAGREAALADRAQYNLGTLAAKRAELALGEKPDDAEPDAREKARSHVEEAIRHFRACLAADPDHGNARRNLETLRVWLKHMEDVWARKDQQKAREQKNVLEFLDWLHAQEGELRTLARATGREADSPMRRTAVAALARRQRELADEIPFLKEKIAKVLQEQIGKPDPATAAAGAKPQSAPDPKQIEAAMTALAQVADDAGAAMKDAGGALDAARFGEADGKGKAAQTGLDGLWLVFGSFEAVVARGVKLAQGAVDGTRPFTTADATAGAATTAPKFSEQPEPQLGVKEFDERVATLADALGQKAAAQQKQLAATPVPPPAPPAPPAPPPPPPPPPDPNAPPPDPNAPPPAPEPSPPAPDPAAERAALEKALAKAIENAPKVGELAAAAQKSVSEDAAAAALHDEEEALRLLKEIEDELPKKPQDDSKQDDKKDQEKKQDQQQKKDSGNDKNDKKEPEKPKDGDKKDGSQPPKPDQLTKEQAQALLRKAVERAKQKADQTKEAQEAVVVPGRVDRDW